jgi:hypothetical protein
MHIMFHHTKLTWVENNSFQLRVMYVKHNPQNNVSRVLFFVI